MTDSPTIIPLDVARRIANENGWSDGDTWVVGNGRVVIFDVQLNAFSVYDRKNKTVLGSVSRKSCVAEVRAPQGSEAEREMRWLKNLWRSLFWVDPYPDFEFKFWAAEDDLDARIEEREAYDKAFAEYIADKAKLGVYR